MKAQIARADLAAALTALAPAIPTRPRVPVLACVLITVTGGTARVVATDYELTIDRTLPVTDSVDGTALVSGLKLRDLVSKFTASTVTLSLEADGMHVKAGRASYRLRTVDPREYPATPKLPKMAGVTTAAGLAHAVRTVSHAATGETDPVRGIFLDTYDGHLWAAATDGFQLGAWNAMDPTWPGDLHREKQLYALARFAVLKADRLETEQEANV